MNKRRLLLVLALGVVMVLLFAASASAASQLECKGELPGGYSFTGPEEITVRIDVRNAGDEDMPGPVKLYYPSLEQVEEFGSPTLAAGSSRSWEGTWKVTQSELEAGAIEFYVYYPVVDEATGELKNKAKKLSFKISYTGAEPELEIHRTIRPVMAQKGQEVSVIYEITNTGAAELTNVTIKENADVSGTAGAIRSIAPGETGKFVFTVKMGTKNLVSEATVSFKAGGKNYSEKVEAATIEYGTLPLTATLTADKKGGAPGDRVKLTLKIKNTGKEDFTNVNVTDENLGTVFSGETVKAGETLTLEQDLTVTETTDLQFVVTADSASGASLETATGRVHVIATDPTKQIVLSVEATADREEVYRIPGGIVRFTITVRNESAVDVKNISVKAVEREVYFFDMIPSGESRTVTRDMEITMAGTFQFTANARDELNQVLSFASNPIRIAFAPPTPVPTEAPLVTPPAPATQPMPVATEAPGWIGQAEQIANIAKWVLAGIVAVLLPLLLIGAIRRGRRKSESKKAMDHLEGANYRDYSTAPKGKRRNEIVSGEDERAAEAAAGQQPEAPAKADAGDGVMAETLRRLYNEAGEQTAAVTEKAAEAAEEGTVVMRDAAEEGTVVMRDAAEEGTVVMRDAAEKAAEAAEEGTVVIRDAVEKAEEAAAPVAESLQEATRRRRAKRS